MVTFKVLTQRAGGTPCIRRGKGTSSAQDKPTDNVTETKTRLGQSLNETLGPITTS